MKKKFHDLNWQDIYRMMSHGLGIPKYRDKFMIAISGDHAPGIRQEAQIAPNTLQDTIDYICFNLVFDLMADFIYYAPKYYLHSGGMITAWSSLDAKNKVKWIRAKEIAYETALQGLVDSASSIAGMAGGGIKLR